MIVTDTIIAYHLHCDCCHTPLEEDWSDIFPDKETAELEATDQGWLVKKSRHLCPYCRETFEKEVWETNKTK